MRRRSRLDRLVDFFRPADDRTGTLLLSRERIAAARSLVGAYYAVVLFFAAGELFAWQAHLAAGELDPRWPVAWLRLVDTRAGIAAILWLHLAGGIVGVTLCRYRWARIVVFVSLLEMMALRFSFGPVNHGEHLGVLVAFVLIFLPAGWDGGGSAGRRVDRGVDRKVGAATLLVFAGVQALILLTYSMAGMWKAGGILEQWVRGDFVTYLHPHGLAQQVAAKMIEGDSVTALGPWLVEHPWVGWLPGIATVYLELFALWVVPRPSLHRPWGLALALFHVLSHLTLGVGFPKNVLWLALFLGFSPFRPALGSRRPGWRRAAADLPVLGRWLARLPGYSTE